MPVSCLTALLSLSLLAAPGPGPALWLYCSANLWVDANIDRLEGNWKRAAASGYTKVLLADSKLAKLGDMDARYFSNVERVKRTAAGLGLEIVPALFSIGYSNDLLWHDPNLAEGLPVRGSLFVVEGGEARLVPDPPVAFREKPDWKDDAVRMEGGAASVEDNPDNARFVQKLKVSPYRCYHISVEIETAGYTGEPRIQVLSGDGKGRALHFKSLGVKPAQDWTAHHVVFDSLESSEVLVYFGVWGEARGKLSWRRWRIEEVGLLNVLRRPGAPCVVEGYFEGRDYERIADPRMGNQPWNGSYEVWHEPPPIRTKLPDGTRLRVSWYFPPIIYEEQVMCCLSEPKVTELLEDQARRMREAWSAKGYMMSFDEVRCLDRDASCQARKMAPGAMLARAARDCTALLGGATAYVWSDMFDPHHNAHADYYLVDGDLAGSWEGLAKEVVVVNWNFGERERSLRFFAGRGHRQVIAGYYDADPKQVRQWLEAARGVEGIVGILYTTWRNAYDDLEEFARQCRL
ncbi:MAG: hypothetical protein HY721_35780 [Planctomycetes bacterium]|nr:hypothetical protein [Planctomycetota bacterium]